MQQFFVGVEINLNQAFKLDVDQAYQCINVLRYQSGQEVLCVDVKHQRAHCRLEISDMDVYATALDRKSVV